MSAPVLLYLLNKLGKRDKMRGLSNILSLFRNEFNKFNKTGARILNSIYHMTLIYLKSHFWHKHVNICHLIRNVIMAAIMSRYQICKPLVVYRVLLHDVLSLPDALPCDKINFI